MIERARSIEYMTAFREDGDAQEDAFYVDCGVTYDGSATSKVTGLDHLEGETEKGPPALEAVQLHQPTIEAVNGVQ